MKKVIFLIVIICISQSIYSQGFSGPEYSFSSDVSETKAFEKSFKITHSISQIIDPGTSVSCNSDGIHYENSYYRVFDLENEFNVNGNWIVQNIEIGIGQAVSGNGNSQPVNIIFYVMSQYDNEIIRDSLTQKGDSLIFEVFDDESGTLKNIEAPLGISVIISPIISQVLVAEVLLPDGHDDGHSFFIGSNDLGETDSTYIMAEHCGVDEPVPMSEILFPDMHMVMNLYGVYENPIPEILSFEIEGQLSDTEIFNDPWEINVVMPVDTSLIALTPVISIPAGFQIIPASGEEVDFSGGPVTYEVNNELGKVSQTWEVSVTNAGPDIVDVQVPGQNGDVLIDNENYTVTVPVPFGTDLTDISPVITIYDDEGFIIDPESEISQDFSSGPVIYTVSHESLPLTQDWEISVIESVGTIIRNLTEKNIKIYPNPANDILQFDLNTIDKIEIFDVNGNLKLIDKSVRNINITNLPSGVYFLRIYTDKSIYIEKLIIAH